MKILNRMKHILVSLILSFFFISCSGADEVFISSSFHEPANEGLRFIYSYDGIHWDSIPGVWLKPEVGVQKVMRDPSIVKGADGTFHLVWTTSWKGDTGFGYSSSKDLIHWTKQKHIPVMAFDTSTVNVWAPELFYDDEKNEFMIVWASTVPYKFKKGLEDEYNNHRLYYVSTKDFNTFSETKLFYDPGYSSIDATIIKRGKNDYVNVFKDNTRPERNLKVTFGKTPLGPWTKPSEAFTDSFSEGPTVLKTGDYYYIYYDAYRKKIFGASKTKDFVSFTDVTDSVSIPEKHKHGTIFTASEKLLKKLLSADQFAQKETQIANKQAYND